MTTHHLSNFSEGEEEFFCPRCVEHDKELNRIYEQQSHLRVEAVMEQRRLAHALQEKIALLAEAQARLADLKVGAEMMLEPFMGLQGAMRRYVEEVKRVAGTPLVDSSS